MKMLQGLIAGAAMTLSLLGAADFGQQHTETRLVSNTSGVAPVTDGLSVLPTEVTTESNDEAQIRQRDIAWEEAVQAKDLKRVLAFYRDDCVGLFTSVPISMGKANMRDIWHLILSRSQLSLHWSPKHIEVARSGELAYDFGSMTLSYMDAKGAKVDFLGKYTVVWKREATGEWRVALDMSNPDTKEYVRYNQ